ncbi:MAG: MBOAT family protein [Magnetococcales bacterium]|nr:MBOAT family protein [Magnetococcales bacterium]MBF0438711.1 MBOAT family protein [Magnetococcales bacterium]
MIFHSIDFLLFLIAVLTIYWVLPYRTQQVFILLASYFFYGYIHPWFLYPLMASTSLDFLVALAMERYPQHKYRFLVTSLVANLSLLGIFKYFGFFVENVIALLEMIGLSPPRIALEIMLPVGISFYTFQSISYTIDVYRGRIPACHNPVDFALYVVFFPQLVAGPIERAQDMLQQIQKTRTLTAMDLREGMTLMVWGFFKKLVIADNVALIANNVFLLEHPPFWVLWAGVFAFSIQILADFSGYTDIARGVARLLGFRLSQNFNHPYLSDSPSEFWKRWHISLSGWIRDYIYIPLGGSHVKAGRMIFNILLTFFLCGLWHGASWNFIIWGVYHSLLIILYRVASSWKPLTILGEMPGIFLIRWLVMFIWINLGWLIFRETNLTHLLHYLTLSPFDDTDRERQYALFLFAKVAIYAFFLCLHAFYDSFVNSWLTTLPRLRYWGQMILVTILFTGILSMRGFVRIDFIYFQF